MEAEITACGQGPDPVKVQDLLARKAVVIAYRILNRFAPLRCGFGPATTTVRVNDGEPGAELQVDFGRMGLAQPGHRPAPDGRRPDLRRLLFPALLAVAAPRQSIAAVIESLEAAWAFFGPSSP